MSRPAWRSYPWWRQAPFWGPGVLAGAILGGIAYAIAYLLS